MKWFQRWFNRLTRRLFGMSVAQLRRKIRQTRQTATQAQQQAHQHRYIKALKLGESIINDWYPADHAIEKQARRWLLSDLLRDIKKQLVNWEIQAESAYEAAFQLTHQLITQGKFQEALTLFEPVHQDFPTPKGKPLLDWLTQTLAGQDFFNLGLLAEQAQDWSLATEHYRHAMAVAPQWRAECQSRLGIIALDQQDWMAAIKVLKGITHPQAARARGFAQAQLGHWKQAVQACPDLAKLDVHRHDPFLQAQRAKHKIQDAMVAQDWMAAATTSHQFLQDYGPQPPVDENLAHCIYPHLEQAVWQQRDWTRAAQIFAQQWSTSLEIRALHNWALAAYYRVLTEAKGYEEFVVAWMGAIANLAQDPSVQSIPWQTSVNLASLEQQLQQQLDDALSPLRHSDPAYYQQIHALYRRDARVLEWRQSSPVGVQIQTVTLTPGCYLRANQGAEMLPAELWGTLYTPWWSAVLACLEGDRWQGIQHKPQCQPQNAAEAFAQRFLDYQEGCYYLEIEAGGYPRWRSAIKPLQAAQETIRCRPDWMAELDQLCQQHFDAISWDVSMAKDFTQFWINLMGSPTAHTYFDRAHRQ
ncbi:hypothetical protein [Acaryochloris sp. IP29b_bin.137]|uniref:tetratricopeptide repeat protein n=1 Tax=Acaryochloris sp. IP29b_bin.137 TaxID=2969217 RepID=UPI0026016986|nr:hypothetical protein [Acaryochloris sp. IP29b_bin.137]